MAITVGTEAAQAKNVALRNAVLQAVPFVNQLVQNSSQISAGEITLTEAALTKLAAAIVDAGVDGGGGE